MLQRDNQKRDKKVQYKHIFTALSKLSNRTVKNDRRGMVGGGAGVLEGKNE